MKCEDIKVGMKVRALVTMDNDMVDNGYGIERCADIGDTLIVRGIGVGYRNCISVSHKPAPDYTFCVAPAEIEEIV